MLGRALGSFGESAQEGSEEDSGEEELVKTGMGGESGLNGELSPARISRLLTDLSRKPTSISRYSVRVLGRLQGNPGIPCKS